MMTIVMIIMIDQVVSQERVPGLGALAGRGAIL